MAGQTPFPFLLAGNLTVEPAHVAPRTMGLQSRGKLHAAHGIRFGALLIFNSDGRPQGATTG
jgi:hypothetical protein